jgi:dTDP-4-amino-4,6-dideoxygalactose transaminase
MKDHIFLSPPHVGDLERDALLAAFDSNWVTSVGPQIEGFEQDIAAVVGVRRAVGVSSGTAALHLVLMSLGLGPGDTVLVPSFTFVATANAVMYAGATPVFVDCDASTWTLDPALVARELARRSALGDPVKAVIAVDLFGQSCHYDALLSACDAHGAILVADSAEGLGATYRGRAVGSFGLAAILSFNGNKILTTGGGGMVLTDDDRLADQVQYLATQAREPVLHYEHNAVGYNYRMNNLLAAMGRAQLSQLADRVAARRAINDRYLQSLDKVPGITFMPRASYGEPTCWLTCLQVDPDVFGASAREICASLAEDRIEARPTWKPLHLQPVFRGRQTIGGAVCEAIYSTGLCLPSGSSLTEEQQQRVVDRLLAARTASPWGPARHVAVTGGPPGGSTTVRTSPPTRATCAVASMADTE